VPSRDYSSRRPSPWTPVGTSLIRRALVKSKVWHRIGPDKPPTLIGDAVTLLGYEDRRYTWDNGGWTDRRDRRRPFAAVGPSETVRERRVVSGGRTPSTGLCDAERWCRMNLITELSLRGIRPPTSRVNAGRSPSGPSHLQRNVMRRARALPVFEILLGGLNVSAKVTILPSLLDIGHLVELGLFPELDVIRIVLLTNLA